MATPRMGSGHRTLVFFAKARSWQGRVIEAVTGSPVSHVAIGDCHVVLDPTLEGNRFHPFAGYVVSDRPILWAVEVPVTRPPHWAPHKAGRHLRPPPTLPTVLRWASRGLIPARNCVTEVVACLRNCGVPVPPRMVSPQQLFDWLRAEGYYTYDFARCTAHDARSDRVGDAGSVQACSCPECVESRGREVSAADDV